MRYYPHISLQSFYNKKYITMLHRQTKAERQQQIAQQLQDSAKRVIASFLSEPKYEAVRQEYATHFDEIKAAIDDPRNTLRTCVEDIQRLSPIIADAISKDWLFFKELHRAIKENILTEEMLKSEG